MGQLKETNNQPNERIYMDCRTGIRRKKKIPFLELQNTGTCGEKCLEGICHIEEGVDPRRENI